MNSANQDEKKIGTHGGLSSEGLSDPCFLLESFEGAREESSLEKK